jgi:hypothetical protein
MSKDLVADFYVRRGQLTRAEIERVMRTLVAAGFELEHSPGAGVSCMWDAVESHDGASLDEALAHIDDPPADPTLPTSWGITLWAQLGELEREDVFFSFDREPRPEGAPLMRVGLSIWYSTESGNFRDPRRAIQFHAWARLLAELIQPIYGWAGTSDGSIDPRPVSPDRVAALEPQPVDWVNVFGASYVARLGADRLLATPAWLVEVLGTGAVAVTLGPHPGEISRESAVQVIAHLGLLPLTA